jgi:hypothetical protein
MLTRGVHVYGEPGAVSAAKPIHIIASFIIIIIYAAAVVLYGSGVP